MHLAILSCSNPSEDSQAYTKYPDSVTGAERIKEAAEARGHRVSRFYEPKFCFEYTETIPRTWYEAQPFAGADVVVYRPNFIEEPSLHTYVPERLRALGVMVLNGTPKILEIKNKIIQHMRLAEAGVAIPRFALAKDPQSATSAVDRLEFPLIVKVSFGTHGKGVFYAGNWETFQPILDYLDVRDGNPVILEEFIASAQSKDIRAFVVGGRVVASMERTARSKDIRANASIGGTGMPVCLSPEDEALALRAAAVFDLDIAGVDLIRSDRGTLVLEVNANPGFRELEACTSVDVATAIVEYAEQRVKDRG